MNAFLLLQDYIGLVKKSLINQKIIIVLLLIFVATFVVQLYFYLKYYSQTARYKKHKQNTVNKPVSVVICARNEAGNLKKNLPAILNQNYPEFEVIVVDDGSEDNTQEILEQFAKTYKNLRTSYLKKNELFFKGKKLALTIGLKAAKYDIVLLTDADCKPVSDMWISLMQSGINEKTEIILGYGGYEKTKGFLNKLIRFDTFFTALQYLGFAIKNNAFMGVGRNLAYKKHLFFDNKGFASHYHIPSGDDDLFINEVATKYNVGIMTDKESFTRSVPKQNFKSWMQQKQRHLTAGKYYKNKHKILLTIEPASRLIFLLSFIAIMTINYIHCYIIILFVFVIATQFIIFKKAMKRLSEQDLLLSSLVINLFLPVVISILHFKNLFNTKHNKWK